MYLNYVRIKNLNICTAAINQESNVDNNGKDNGHEKQNGINYNYLLPALGCCGVLVATALYCKDSLKEAIGKIFKGTETTHKSKGDESTGDNTINDNQTEQSDANTASIVGPNEEEIQSEHIKLGNTSKKDESFSNPPIYQEESEVKKGKKPKKKKKKEKKTKKKHQKKSSEYKNEEEHVPDESTKSIYEVTHYKNVGVRSLSLSEYFIIAIFYNKEHIDKTECDAIINTLNHKINKRKITFEATLNEYKQHKTLDKHRTELTNKIRVILEKLLKRMQRFALDHKVIIVPYFQCKRSGITCGEDNFYHSLIDMMSLEILTYQDKITKIEPHLLVLEIVSKKEITLEQLRKNNFSDFIFNSMLKLSQNILDSFSQDLDQINESEKLPVKKGDLNTICTSKISKVKENEDLKIYLQCAGSTDITVENRKGQALICKNISNIQDSHAKNDIVYSESGKDYTPLDIFTKKEREILTYQSTYMTRCYNAHDKEGKKIKSFNKFNIMLNAGNDFNHNIFKKNIDCVNSGILHSAWCHYYVQPTILMDNGVDNTKVLNIMLSDQHYSGGHKTEMRNAICKTIVLFKQHNSQVIKGENSDFIQLVLYGGTKGAELESKKMTIDKIIKHPY